MAVAVSHQGPFQEPLQATPATTAPGPPRWQMTCDNQFHAFPCIFLHAHSPTFRTLPLSLSYLANVTQDALKFL